MFSSKFTCCSYHGKNPGNLPKGNALSEIGEHWIEDYLKVLVSKRSCHDSGG
jgi:hypothetical protein